MEHRNGTVVAYQPGDLPMKVAHSRTKGDSIVTTIKSPLAAGIQNIKTVTYSRKTGVAQIQEVARAEGHDIPIHQQQTTFKKGLKPGLDLYLQIAEPRMRPGMSRR